MVCLLINFKILEIFIILYIKLYVFLYVKFYKISSLALMSATPFEYIAEVTIASAAANSFTFDKFMPPAARIIVFGEISSLKASTFYEKYIC